MPYPLQTLEAERLRVWIVEELKTPQLENSIASLCSLCGFDVRLNLRDKGLKTVLSPSYPYLRLLETVARFSKLREGVIMVDNFYNKKAGVVGGK